MNIYDKRDYPGSSDRLLLLTSTSPSFKKFQIAGPTIRSVFFPLSPSLRNQRGWNCSRKFSDRPTRRECNQKKNSKKTKSEAFENKLRQVQFSRCGSIFFFRRLREAIRTVFLRRLKESHNFFSIPFRDFFERRAPF